MMRCVIITETTGPTLLIDENPAHWRDFLYNDFLYCINDQGVGMAEIQNDLFEGDPDAHQLLDHMDKIPVAELERQWPQMLVSLIDVLECELKRQTSKQNDPRQLARKLTAALSHYMGGRSYYLPNGEALFNSLRDDKIYRDYNGKNMTELLQKYQLGQTQFYRIISRQRQLNVRRHQRDLFSH